MCASDVRVLGYVCYSGICVVGRIFITDDNMLQAELLNQLMLLPCSPPYIPFGFEILHVL